MHCLRMSPSTLVLAVPFVLGCSKDTVCPPLWTFCYTPLCSPHFFLRTSDGSPSIASATVLSGDCRVDGASFIDAGVSIDAGVLPAADVLVYTQPYFCSANPAPCTVRVALTNGKTITIVNERFQGDPVYVGRCEDRTTCCERSRYTEYPIYGCGFVQSEFTLDTTATDAEPAVDSSVGSEGG